MSCSFDESMRTLFDSVDHLEQALTFHRERHSVLAGNIANVDTPGYRPFDLHRLTQAIEPGALATTRTHSGHVGPPGGDTTLVFDDSGQSIGADGNGVNLERELAKIDANRVRYAAASELVSRRFALLRYAAGDGAA